MPDTPKRHKIYRHWWFDADTNCWRNADQTACVARDFAGRAPWGAWHTSNNDAVPDSRHATLTQAIAACEAAIKEAANEPR